jgi:hypothetical protein
LPKKLLKILVAVKIASFTYMMSLVQMNPVQGLFCMEYRLLKTVSMCSEAGIQLTHWLMFFLYLLL